MAWAHVQDFTEVTVSSGQTGSTSATATTAGNTLICSLTGLTTQAGVANITVSDGSNTWTTDKAYGVVGTGAAIASCPNIAGGTITITVTLAGSTTNWAFLVQEFSGGATSSILDVADGDGDDTTTNPRASNAGITTTGADLALVVYAFDRNPSPSGPTGWTGVQGGVSSFGYYAYKIFTGTTSGERGAITPNGTPHYDAVIAAYKPGAGPPPPPSGPPLFRCLGG